MPSNNAARRDLMSRAFAALYGGQPEIWSRAPGRVDLMGSHTDYNEGYVLTMTIDRDTWIAARRTGDRSVSIYSLNLEASDQFCVDRVDPLPAGAWANYPRGVAAIMGSEGHNLSGFQAVVHSTVPLSSGLSSSAALEIATAYAFAGLSELKIEPVELALLCQMAECSFVGMNCGILDQYTSALGQEGCALLLDCRHLSSEPVPIAPGVSTVICDTRVKRELTGSEYPERRRQCEQGAQILSGFYRDIRALRDVTPAQLGAHAHDLPAVVARRCRFIIEENRRVLDLAQALQTGSRAGIGALTAASFAGARDLYEIASPEMAGMMAAMLSAPGIIGARQAGAGFGGCMIAFVEQSALADFAGHVITRYRAATEIEPAVYPVNAAPGAGPLEFEAPSA